MHTHTHTDTETSDGQYQLWKACRKGRLLLLRELLHTHISMVHSSVAFTQLAISFLRLQLLLATAANMQALYSWSLLAH